MNKQCVLKEFEDDCLKKIVDSNFEELFKNIIKDYGLYKIDCRNDIILK